MNKFTSTYSFSRGNRGFSSYVTVGFGKKSRDFTLIRDKSEAAPKEGCYYHVEVVKELPPQRLGQPTICFVRFPTREADEAIFMEEEIKIQQRQEAVANQEKELQNLKDEIATKELPGDEEISRFFGIEKPGYFVQCRLNDRLDVNLRNARTWMSSYMEMMSYQNEFDNIIKYIEDAKILTSAQWTRKTNAENEVLQESEDLKKDLVDLRFNKFLPSLDKEVEVYWDESFREFRFKDRVYGRYTAYEAESSDGYRPAGSYETTGWQMVFLPVKGKELEELKEEYKDVLEKHERIREIEKKSRMVSANMDEPFLEEKRELARTMLSPPLAAKAIAKIR